MYVCSYKQKLPVQEFTNSKPVDALNSQLAASVFNYIEKIMFRFLLKKRTWNRCPSRSLLNKPGAQGFIQLLIIARPASGTFV